MAFRKTFLLFPEICKQRKSNFELKFEKGDGSLEGEGEGGGGGGMTTWRDGELERNGNGMEMKEKMKPSWLRVERGLFV